jgi:hypothetical protein
MAAESTSSFMEVTGADQATAEQMMAASGNDLQAAVALFYAAETGGAAEAPDDSDDGEEEPPAPSLPQGDLVGDILNNARKDEPAEPQPWSGAGRTLGSQPAAAGVPVDPEPEAGAPEPRHNAKRVRIIFWADGFTVEDLHAEEEEAAAAAAAAPAARKTGIQTLGDHRAAGGASARALPELRRYEDNKQFMVDLKNGLPPSEFREIDLSSGTPVRAALARAEEGSRRVQLGPNGSAQPASFLHASRSFSPSPLPVYRLGLFWPLVDPPTPTING